jgi:hypothetical protein
MTDNDEITVNQCYKCQLLFTWPPVKDTVFGNEWLLCSKCASRMLANVRAVLKSTKKERDFYKRQRDELHPLVGSLDAHAQLRAEEIRGYG